MFCCSQNAYNQDVYLAMQTLFKAMYGCSLILFGKVSPAVVVGWLYFMPGGGGGGGGGYISIAG